MRVVDWFAGIGGFRLGLEQAGEFETVAYSEIDPYACAVYDKRWPGTPNLGDIRTIDPADIPEADLWCGGFPCQPFSTAGKQLAEQDERNLWPALRDCIEARKPPWCLLENVPNLCTKRYSVEIVQSLTALGYGVEWTTVGAWQVGAPHRRDRLWIVAYLPDASGLKVLQQQRRGRCERSSGLESGWTDTVDARRDGSPWCVPDSDGIGRGAREREVRRGGSDAAGCCKEVADGDGDGGRRAIERQSEHGGIEGSLRGELDRCGTRGPRYWPFGWIIDPAEVEWADPADMADPARERRHRSREAGAWREHSDGCRFCGADQGPASPLLGRVAYGIPSRVDRLRCLGNAVVPQVVAAIARRVFA